MSMTVKIETSHAAEFIMSEASRSRSRENGILITGQNLAVGTVVELSGAKLTALTGALNTAGDLVTAAVGILIYAADATDADVPVAYIARDAEVNQKLLVFPTESTAGGEEAATIASLAALGIIVRD
jgi:hypothetical protein